MEFAEQLREARDDHRRGGHRGVEAAAAADPDDLAGVHPRRPAARLCDGAGQEARHSVGTAVAGGMFVSTFLNILFIPVLYVVVQTMSGVENAGSRGTTRINTGDFLTLFLIA